MVSSSATAPRSGFYYFSQGWKLVTQPGIRRFVILPLLVNILLMGGAFWWLFTQLDVWIPSLMSHVPDWLQWLSYLLWPHCGHLGFTGLRLFLFNHCQLDRSPFQWAAGGTA
ncbi:putative sulfate transport protein CysZ [Citrobacter koseri]|uniref:Putative sulfate transport protein CysZ n=1 Tax=Citrobacter koseri TaxID=545 RepID=A0A2X2VSG0_CITKO|nr:putative sulfate transport protein CysZ [Citrobacter koseri]